MAWEAIKKIAINFAVVFIIASVFSSVAPSQAQKAYAFIEDKLGFGEPSIGYFTVAVDKTRCKYESSGFWMFAKHWLSDECEPEEVDKVWKEYLKIIVKRYSMG